jgi:tRNA uridine 5-carboxymethylaminomethyl modification enzyme
MFTSRVEYRLILREDNADLRLRRIGYKIGLVPKRDYLKAEKKREAIKEGIDLLKNTRIKPGSEINAKLAGLKSPALKKGMSLEELLKRPQIKLKDLLGLDHLKLKISSCVLSQVETEVKYAGFIQRQLKDVEKFRNLEKINLPADIDYKQIPALSREIKEKLQIFRPLNLGQASRISGVTPAALSLLMIWLRKINAQR